jgi:hypothetical protein
MAGMAAEEKKALITSSRASVLSSPMWSLRSSPDLCLQISRWWSCRGVMRQVTNSTPTMVPITPASRRSQIHGQSVFRASSGTASLA